jgi:hypothetical protein
MDWYDSMQALRGYQKFLIMLVLMLSGAAAILGATLLPSGPREVAQPLAFIAWMLGIFFVGAPFFTTRYSDTPYTGPRAYQPPPPSEPQPAQPEPARPALPPPAAATLAPYSPPAWDDDEGDDWCDAPPAPRVVAVLRPGQRALPPPPDVEPLVFHRRPEPEPVRARKGKGKGKQQ